MSDNDRMTGAQLREARARLGMTGPELCAALRHGAPSTLYDMEAGRRTVSEPVDWKVRALLAGYRPEWIEDERCEACQSDDCTGDPCRYD